MKRKNITIRDDQEEYIKANSINLSRLIQRTLDSLMDVGGVSITDIIAENNALKDLVYPILKWEKNKKISLTFFH